MQGGKGRGTKTAMLVEKSLVYVITDTRCSCSVMQCKEAEEKEVAKKKERRTVM